ncbi:MAG: hypothetical protein QXE74_05185, partial [Candidatus Bathyarchaeia archaeon]
MRKKINRPFGKQVSKLYMVCNLLVFGWNYNGRRVSSPPPLPPPPPYAEGIHLPGTNLFMSVRRQLSSLEQPAIFKPGRGILLGFISVFIVAGIFRIPCGLIDQYVIVPALGPSGSL